MKLGGLGGGGRRRRSRRCRSRPALAAALRGVPRTAPSSRSPTAGKPRTLEPWGLSSQARATGTSSATTATATRSARSAPIASTATSTSATRRVHAARRLPARRPRRGPARGCYGEDEPVDASACSSTPRTRRRVVDQLARRRGGRAPGPTAPSSSRSPVANRAAFRSFVLGLLDHAEVLGTARAARRHRRVARTRSRRGHRHEPAPARRRRAAAHPRARAVDRRPPGHDQGRARAALRHHASTQLDDDLELVLMIGVPPYSPGDYIDVDEDDDGGVDDPARRVLPPAAAAHAGRGSRAARRRARAARGARLRSRRARSRPRSAKLEARARPPGPRRRRRRARRTSTTSATRPRHHERVEIDYWSAGRDELTTRRIDPGVVFFALGAWYVGACCHRAERRAHVPRRPHPRGPRRPASTSTRHRPAIESGDVYNPAPDDPRVTLRLAPAAAWVAGGVPDTSRRPSGPTARLDVVLAVSEPAWLERLLAPPRPRRRGRRPAGAARRPGADGRRAGSSPAIPRSPRATPALDVPNDRVRARPEPRVRGCPE